MRAFALCIVLVIAAVAAACQEPDQTFGEPNGIVGKKLPNEGAPLPPPASGSSGTAPTVTISMKTKHEAVKGPPPGGKIVCLDCHKAGGTAVEFSFGGQSVVGATIKVGTLAAVGCDTDGYFWLKGGPLPKGSRATVGKGDKAKEMSGSLEGIPGGSCDQATSCHGNAGTLPIDPG